MIPEELLNDPTGKKCYNRLCEEHQTNRQQILQNLIIEKDLDGSLCFAVASGFRWADKKRLEEAVIKKDKEGAWIHMFAVRVKHANVANLHEALKKKGVADIWRKLTV